MWLWKRCAWKVQEIRLGGLSEAAKARLEELISGLDLPWDDRSRTVSGVLRVPPKVGQPGPGTVLTRIWRGQQISVRMCEGGACEYSGVRYRSLTAAAQAASGQHVSGPLFWGIKKRGAQA